jgi:hypothetical protein
LGERKDQVCLDILLDDSWPDDHRRRVWLQTVTREPPHLDLVLDLLPKVFALTDSEVTNREIISSRHRLTEACGSSKDNRYRLAQSLLRAFTTAASLESKNGLLAWIRELDGATVLKELDQYDGLSHTDLDLLDETFKRSPHVARWRKNHPEEDS